MLVFAFIVGETDSTILPLSVRTARGQRIVLRFSSDSRPTVLYFISPTCVWCERNLPSIQKLAREARSSFRFVGVAVGRVSQSDLDRQNLGFEVVVHSNPSVLATYGLRGTPYTMIVSPQGRVLESWPGAYGAAVRADIQRFFHVDLPPM